MLIEEEPFKEVPRSFCEFLHLTCEVYAQFPGQDEVELDFSNEFQDIDLNLYIAERKEIEENKA